MVNIREKKTIQPNPRWGCSRE